MVVASVVSPTLLGAQSAVPAEQAAASGELTMAFVVRRAVAHSAVMAVAEQQRVAATARVRQARAALLPTVGVTAARSQWTRNSAEFGLVMRDASGQPLLNAAGEIVGPVRALDVRASLQHRLLDPAAIARVRAARAAASAADAATGATATDVSTAAALAFVDALRTDAQLAAITQDSTMAAALAADAARRHAAGLALALDVTRADAQLMNTRAALVSARAERVRAHLMLTRAIGLSADTPLVFADSLAALAMMDSGSLGASEVDGAQLRGAVQSALQRRDDVRSAAAQVTAAERVRAALRSEYLPTISVVADRGALGVSRNRMLPTYSWSVQLAVPVFDGFLRAHRIEEQKAQLQITAVRLRDLAEQVELEIRDARVSRMTAQAALEAANDRLALAERALDQTRERCEAGLDGNAEVITAQVALSAARVNRIARLADVATARILTRRVQGEPQTTKRAHTGQR